jgi:hypothetical protein
LAELKKKREYLLTTVEPHCVNQMKTELQDDKLKDDLKTRHWPYL